MQKDELIAKLEVAREAISRAIERTKQAETAELDFPKLPEVEELGTALRGAGAGADFNVGCDSNC